jgi:hypothetical protein
MSREQFPYRKIVIINTSGVPERAFNRYFGLMNASRRQFQWLLLYNELELTMWVRLGNDRRVIGQYMVSTAQEVEVSLEQAIEIGRMNGLKEPLSGYPVTAL